MTPEQVKELARQKQAEHTNEKEEKKSKPSAATILTEIGNEAELWHDSARIAYATVGGKTYPVRSRDFRLWLSGQYYAAKSTAPPSQSLADALNVLEGIAIHGREQHPVHLRIAGDQTRIVLFAADDDWNAYVIDRTGWRTTDKPPVRFRRPKAMIGLPKPVRGGNVSELRRFVNVAADADWYLLIAWLVQAMRPTGPYPVLALHGEQGSAKSTTARVCRSLIDPNSAPLRSSPRDERDLAIAGNNGWIVALDNLSFVPDWLSDALCRLSTGGGFSTRSLFTDSEETIFDSMRPIILTGIEDLASRGDLLERSIIVHLPTIPPERRKTERQFWSDFESARPRILGALLDYAAGALRTIPDVVLRTHPRMADFAEWAVAAERGAGGNGDAFLDAYLDNQSGANEQALESSPVAPVLIDWIKSVAEWEGTAADLLKTLTEKAGDSAKSKSWPAKPNTLSGKLRRLAPNLRRTGIDVSIGDRTGDKSRRRIITIKMTPAFHRPSSSDRPEHEEKMGDDRTIPDDQGPIADDPGRSHDSRESREIPQDRTMRTIPDDQMRPQSSRYTFEEPDIDLDAIESEA